MSVLFYRVGQLEDGQTKAGNHTSDHCDELKALRKELAAHMGDFTTHYTPLDRQTALEWRAEQSRKVDRIESLLTQVLMGKSDNAGR